MSNNEELARLWKLQAEVNHLVLTSRREPEELSDIYEEILRPLASKWKNKQISFSVTSDGTTGEEWITRLQAKNFYLDDSIKELLLSKDFKPTSGITSEVVVLRGSMFKEGDLVVEKVRKYATCLNLETPNAEIACLMRERFTDKELCGMGGLWIVVMHEPIYLDDFPNFFMLSWAMKDHSLGAISYSPGELMGSESGFAFTVPQISV